MEEPVMDTEGLQQNQNGKRYALLLATNDSDYVKKMYGGYHGVFLEAFGGDEEEKWDLFRVVEGEFPDARDLSKYDAFVVSGSPHDAYGNDLWILKLCSLLRKLHSMHKRILGVCFGHQVLCRALGGLVGKANSGWDIGVRQLTMVDDLEGSKLLLPEVEDVPAFPSVFEVHQDEVWELPYGAQLIAYSAKTNIEMFSIDDHILGIQGHPEYSKDIMLNLIDRLAAKNSINADMAEDARKMIEIVEPDHKYWRKLCKNFLKGAMSR